MRRSKFRQVLRKLRGRKTVKPCVKSAGGMKKILSVFLIALLALAVLSVIGVLLFRHFVADQIMDKGGMMNPDYISETDTVSVLDGDHTYVDNEKLLQVITGTWSSEDGRYAVKLDSEYRIVFSLDGETLLESHIHFAYPQPGTVRATEFSLDCCTLQKEDEAPAGEITSFYHETSEEDADGRLIIEIDLAGSSETVELKKQEN